MKTIDILYQESVDREANRILELTINEVLKVNDYGRIETVINEHPISISYWHYKFNDNLHHIVFLNERRYLFIFTKKYLSGIKLENERLTRLTDIEIGDYD